MGKVGYLTASSTRCILKSGLMLMKYMRKAISFRIARFAVAGAGNTAFNFLVLNLVFYGLHQGKLVSSIIATSCAVAFSFALNRSFVFLDGARPVRKFGRFVIVTALGVLLVQNTVYALGVVLLRGH